MAVAYLLGGTQEVEEVPGLKDAANGLGVHIGTAINYWHVKPGMQDWRYLNEMLSRQDSIIPAFILYPGGQGEL